MRIPFQNILFLKEFLACKGCFGLFTKIKKGFGTSFWCTFSAWFFHKNVIYLILYQWPKFQHHTFFPFQDIKQNGLLSSYLGIINFEIYLRSSSQEWLTERKKGECGNTKIWISWEGKGLVRWNKKHLHSF